MSETGRISLVLSDVDGTLVDDDKRLSKRSIEAVSKLRDAGIRFAVTSSRPPRGMAMLFEPLDLDAPIAGFNGGLCVDRDLSIMAERTLAPDVAGRAIDLIRRQRLDAWVFRGNEWLVSDEAGAYVDHEIFTVQFQPKVVRDLSAQLDGIAKIVGVGRDFDRVGRAETIAAEELGGDATVARSQSYYLDFTHPEANKGVVVDMLSQRHGIPTGEIMTIGDGFNDVSMFARAGWSVAMGNASPEVKARASAVTGPNGEDGFAEAIERYALRNGR